MQITVFGANGKVGSIVVQKALLENIQVVAFIHSKTNLKSSPNLRIIIGDIYNISDVDSAIKGSTAVISALGSWGTQKKDVLTSAMKNIIPTMQKYDVKRIISLTGADAPVKGENNNLIGMLSGTLLRLFAKKIIQDGQNHIKLLMDSALDWTVIRSPVMNGIGKASDFRLVKTKPLPWATINRNSVAQALVNLIKESDFVTEAPFIERA